MTRVPIVIPWIRVGIALAAMPALGPILSRADQVVAPPQSRAKQILEATGVRGGLVIHLGCGDGKLTASLRAGESYLVHGLDADAENVEKAREHIQSLGLYGKVSVDRFDGRHLPYVDNLVNLVVAERLGEVAMDEVMRVLCPEGVAYVGGGGAGAKSVKPWPDEIDEWTRYLYDASGNAVSHHAAVGPPRRFPWIRSPKWARHHDRMAGLTAAVAAGGGSSISSTKGRPLRSCCRRRRTPVPGHHRRPRPLLRRLTHSPPQTSANRTPSETQERSVLYLARQSLRPRRGFMVQGLGFRVQDFEFHVD